MKKRILSLIITVLLILPCFVASVSAAKPIPEEDAAKFSQYKYIIMSDDYKTLAYNGNTYVRFDASIISFDYSNGYTDNNSTLEEIESIDYEFNETETIVRAWIYFKDDSTFSTTYITESAYAELLKLKSEPDKYSIDFNYPEDNRVTTTKEKFLGEKTTLVLNESWITDTFYVNAYSSDNGFYVLKGKLLLMDDRYYYLDYAENLINDPSNFYSGDYGEVTVYEITDQELLEQIDNGYDKYNSDAIGFLVSDFSENISTVMLCLVFVLLPLASLVVFLILSFRAKKSTYKKLFRIIYITSAIELFIFVTTIILFVIN